MSIDNTVQLTRIVAPNLSEIDYGTKLQEVFDNINENFKKVASMPFVQGVQGDSYTLVVKHVFEKVGSIIQVTSEGAELLNSIFYDVLTNPITANKNLNQCKIALESLTLGGVSVLDIFDTVGSDNICNNLYFYAIIDDMGQEHDKYLGQLYYFIDARVSALANARAKNEQTDALTTFSDYSGFYQYKPENEGTGDPVYYKTDIIPTIYYDSTRDDICWKLNGKNTGISAVGAKGEDGTDAALQFVKCKVTSNNANTESSQFSATISAVFKPDPNETIESPWSESGDDLKKLEDGLALICIAYTLDEGGEEISWEYAFGSILINTEANSRTAYWSSDTVIHGMVTDTAIIRFFDRVGLKDGASIKALRIPADAGSDPQLFHTLGINNPINDTGVKDVLIQRQKIEAGSGSPILTRSNSTDVNKNSTGGNIIVDNYNIKLERQIDGINPKPSVILSDTDIELKNGSTKIKLSNGNGNVLEVKGGVDMNPENGGHFTTDVQFSGGDAFTIRSGADNNKKPLILDASQVQIGFGSSEPTLNVLGNIKNTISYTNNDIFFKPNTWGTTDQTRFTHNIVAKGSGDDVDNDAQYGGAGSHIMLGAEKITLYKEINQHYKTNVIARADVYMAANETREYGSDGTPGDVPDSVACLSSGGTIRNTAYTQFLGPAWNDMANLWTEAREITGEGTGMVLINISYINIPWEYLASNDFSYIVYNKAKNDMGCIYNLDQQEKTDWPAITQNPDNYNILGIAGRMGIYLRGIYFHTDDTIPRVAIINPTNNALFRFFINVSLTRLSINMSSENVRLRIGTWNTYTNSGKIFQSIYPNYPLITKYKYIINDGLSYEYLVATDSGAQGHRISQASVEDM